MYNAKVTLVTNVQPNPLYKLYYMKHDICIQCTSFMIE